MIFVVKRSFSNIIFIIIIIIIIDKQYVFCTYS